MRVLAIDHGDKKIGLALSDPLQITAQPFGCYEVRGKKADKAHFISLVADYDISEIIVGHPLQMDGARGERALKVEAFVGWLRSFLDLPIGLWDERLTTREAYDILRQQNIKQREAKKYKDQLSAGIILSEYLESKRSNREGASS